MYSLEDRSVKSTPRSVRNYINHGFLSNGSHPDMVGADSRGTQMATDEE